MFKEHEFKTLCDEALQGARALFQKRFTENVGELITSRLKQLFASKRVRNQFPEYYGKCDDSGYVYDEIDKMVTDKVFSEDNQVKINAIIQREWDQMLEKATLEAMQHHARSIAFNRVKETK